MKELGAWVVIATVAGAAAGGCQGAKVYGNDPGSIDGGGSGGRGTGGTTAAVTGSGGQGGGGSSFGNGGGTAADAGRDGRDGTGGAAEPAGSGGAGGMGGMEATGGAGDAGGRPCTGCAVSVKYTCLSDAPDQISFVLDVTNSGTVAFLLGDLTVRYWYTVDAGKEQELNCDNARFGCMRLVNSVVPVTPVRNKANEYVQVGFMAGALDVAGSTGMIQLRLHNKDFTPVNQTDDYSLDNTARGTGKVSNTITAYIRGVLIWGVEPS
jgi:hypothetical protein